MKERRNCDEGKKARRIEGKKERMNEGIMMKKRRKDGK